MTMLQPASAAEVAEIVAWAASESQGLEIIAGGSKRGLGRPSRATHRLDIAALRGIVDYDPAELVLTVQAATPMRDIQALLAAERQMLAFEPPEWRALHGGSGEPTLGGVVACNISGPRRVRAGAARDHFLGFTAVNGWGDAWKAGGKVVKNVTGYDLCKLQAGAYGTLSVLTELTVRVLPKPEQQCSLLVAGLSDAEAIRTLSGWLNTEHEVSAAAHLPPDAVQRSSVQALADGAGRAVTLLRLEGPRPSVAFRANALRAAAPGAIVLDEADSAALWTEIGAVQPLLAAPNSIVWRICPTPSEGPALARQIRAEFQSASLFYDWGGGLVWLELDAGEAGADCGAAKVRRAVAASGGHATLLRAPDDARERVAVFEPVPAVLDALARRVKAGFDPRGILNPGRMQQGL